MNKIGWISLILIAIVVVAGGVYWYYEFMPVGKFFSKPAAPIETVTTVQKSAAELPLPAPIEEDVPVPVVEEAPPVEELDLFESISTSSEEPVAEQPEIKSIELPSLPTAIDEQSQELQEDAPIILPEKPETRTLNANSIPLPETLVGRIEAPVPPAKKVAEPTVAKEAPADYLPETQEEPPSNPVPASAGAFFGIPEEEQTFSAVDETDVDTVVEETVDFSDIVEEQTPSITEKASPVIMGEPERELKDLGSTEISLQIQIQPGDWTFPSSANDITGEFQMLFGLKKLPISLGGTIGVGKLGTQTKLDLLFTSQYTFRAEETVSFPIYLSLGASFILGSSPDWGGTIQAGAGISWAFIPNDPNFRFFVKAGVGFSLYNKGGSSFHVGPIRLGFSYSF